MYTLHVVPAAPPQNISITGVSALSVTLSWEAPAKEYQNGLITGYVVVVHRGERRKEVTGNNATIGSLRGNVHYTLSVAAKTGVGIGVYSAVVEFKTKINGMKDYNDMKGCTQSLNTKF
jgi:hypothetical protein